MAKQHHRSRVLLAILAALFAVAAVVGALTLTTEPVEAAAPSPGVCVYFSDATMTVVVGARGTGCCGEVINWGITTRFKQCEELNCPQVICPQ